MRCVALGETSSHLTREALLFSSCAEASLSCKRNAACRVHC